MKLKEKSPATSKNLSPAARLALVRNQTRMPCPIVGIGASAGGLEAFSQLLKHLPVDSGLGFVLVQHLDPQHESALTEILARTTVMTVREVTNNLRVEANNVYIIPPNKTLSISRGVLMLAPRSKNSLAPRSIDFFLEALAKDQGERAIGVILSGNATDGTMGLESIKAAGGFTFAQDKSARYDSMPRSAVAAGCVDLVLPPASIARELGRIAKHPFLARLPANPVTQSSDSLVANAPVRWKADRSRFQEGRPSKQSIGTPQAGLPSLDPLKDGEQKGYNKILLLLRNHCGVDFSQYKTSTIHRRIARRAVLNRHTNLVRYADFLQGNLKELEALYTDALINVTSFFRNGDVFAALKTQVFSKLLAEGGHDPIRVWVLGCSTGQEAYSVAMAFMECAEKYPRARKLQIFATDLNEANLVKARIGFYPATLLQDVSPERMRRFFSQVEGGYQVIKVLRESIVFARQNMMSDPPFSRMDLISCRNVMIYLDGSLQKKVIPTFHYALKKGGFLVLGASETVGGFGDLFSTVAKKQKLFAKKAPPTRAFQIPIKQVGGRVSFAKPSRQSIGLSKKAGIVEDAFRSDVSAEREADRVTVNQFAPPAVLVNADLQVLQFRGPTGDYLESPTGKATFDLLRMAREGLMLPLRTAIQKAVRANKAVRREMVAVTLNGRARPVNIEVIPLKNLKERCFLILFEEAEENRAESPRRVAAAAKNGAIAPKSSRGKRYDSIRVASLERDLSETRDYLQSVQEHQEVANEELQATNEEGQSANEELQSLNEELETSKEELESTNEELTTVNDEMVSRNMELNRLIEGRKKDEAALRASDERFRALFDLGPVGVYSCDVSGRIQNFNRYASAMWGRTPKTGEHADKFCGSSKLHDPDGAFIPHAHCPMASVLNGKIPEARDMEVVIERPDGSRITVVVNIVPLKNALGEITGAINCFYDITERKRSDTALRDAQEQLSAHAGKLESLVVERTAELTKTNLQLESSLDSIKKGKEEYQALFADSLVMQEKLRHLTRLIIIAQEEERKKISRELHDEVVQTLIGINIELTALGRGGAIGEAALKNKISDTQRLVEGSVDAVHRFARGLRPAVLDDLGLIPALHAYCKGLTAKKKLKIQMTAFGGVEALDDVGITALFRVAQEALTNVVRHAKATFVKVSIGKIGDAIRMEISDNGQAFPVDRILSAKNPKRLGLIGMKERIEMIGGTMGIESIQGMGTTVRADIPFTLRKAKA